MQAKELKAKNREEIEKMLHEKREALRALRSATSGSKTRNVKEISALRKDVARMLTEINSRSEEGQKVRS